MTGAACLWCSIAVISLCFGVGLAIAWCYNACDDGLKDSLPWAAGMVILFVLAFMSGIMCTKTYDINFAVALKNIQYNVVVTHEENVDIKMDYKDIKSDEQEKK